MRHFSTPAPIDSVGRLRPTLIRARTRPRDPEEGPLDQVILYVLGVAITPWKLVGYLGVLLFAGRWFVQMYYSQRHRRPVVPTVFWLMSISGSLLLLS